MISKSRKKFQLYLKISIVLHFNGFEVAKIQFIELIFARGMGFFPPKLRHGSGIMKHVNVIPLSVYILVLKSASAAPQTSLRMSF